MLLVKRLVPLVITIRLLCTRHMHSQDLSLEYGQRWPVNDLQVQSKHSEYAHNNHLDLPEQKALKLTVEKLILDQFRKIAFEKFLEIKAPEFVTKTNAVELLRAWSILINVRI